MHKLLIQSSKSFIALSFSLLSIAAVAADEAPRTYEELMGRLLEKQDVANVQLFDRALQTSANQFEQRYIMSLGALATPESSNVIRTSLYHSLPTKDLRQEAASKILLSGIVKPEELYREYQVHNQSISENPREMASLSSPLLSFLYYQAYKKYESKTSRDEDLEKAIMSRFKEQSAKAKVEMIDPARAQVLSNCDDTTSDLSVTLVALSSIPKDKDSTLDVVTHHFVYPQKGFIGKILTQSNPKTECEAKVAELKKDLESARQAQKLLLLSANADYFKLESFQKFNTGEFIESCRDSFSRLWAQYRKLVESSMPLSARHDQKLKDDLFSELTFCRNSTQEDIKRVVDKRNKLSEQKREQIIRVDQNSPDHASWGKAYAAIAKDPSLRPPELPDTDPSLLLSYHNKYPQLDETAEQKKQRLKVEAENAKLAEVVRAEQRVAQEAREKENLEAEKQFLSVKAQWDKEWSKGYSDIVNGNTSKSFDEAMKDLARRRATVEATFFASNENYNLLQAKNRIEARAAVFNQSVHFTAPTIGREITPEYIATLTMRREAETRALQVRLKAHDDYLKNKSLIDIPRGLSESQKNIFVVRYLDKLESETYQKELEALKLGKK